jgi:hypothetical protein
MRNFKKFTNKGIIKGLELINRIKQGCLLRAFKIREITRFITIFVSLRSKHTVAKIIFLTYFFYWST